MVGRVIWTEKAINDRDDILEYWFERTGSKTYSTKLYTLFKSNLRLILKQPEIGKPTEAADIRIKIIRDYFIFYKISDNNITVLTLWDSRRNPNKLKLK
ncbi:type II toxin-antitoxin system RelE/ParE family toxin [Flavobacterium subsaxonicum]|uniref:Addiction module toxin RelE n=1 Tax=Flavobacterium subsaxonicum WB 4.1-42 = DSM 21790 TaxID=1121898 RepID=A0A0A2MII7_9FLAO|nr:type II toxin-antitoxin system RelE/ParE family toxin [Flavobacterium subsaxonicum]KGO91263.1 hypothetical protein Q766_19090 [Flavobacterium subsaxonicum WB 4.1-42 = DSM 21790]